MYASVSYYLVKHPVQLGPGWSIVILTLGVMAIIINYMADKQVGKPLGRDWDRQSEQLATDYGICVV